MRTTLFIFFFVFVGAAAAAAKPKTVKETAKCPRNHLEAKTCSLSALGLKIQVTESKISIFDGVWRELQDFPFPGEDRKWEEVSLRKIGKRKFLEIKLWDKPEGEAGIQSLLWFGYEIKDLKPVAKWKETLQKRTVVKPSEAPEILTRPKGRFEDPRKVKYLYDKPERYSISVDKQGTLIWQVGHRKKSEKDQASVELVPPAVTPEENKDAKAAGEANK